MPFAKVYPAFRPNREGVVFDTLTATRLLWPNIADSDKGRVARKTLDGRNIGLHSLDAWGQRLGCWKGDYAKQREARLKAQHEAEGADEPRESPDAEVTERWTGVYRRIGLIAGLLVETVGGYVVDLEGFLVDPADLA